MAKAKEIKSNVYVVPNTKGGVGKSILSKFILPTLLYKEGIEINVYEIDNNNTANNLQSDLVNYKTFKIDDKNEALFDVSFNEDEQNIISIIDVGGGDDVKAVLTALNKNKILNPNFIIPTNDDDEQFNNVLETINIIKELEDNPKIRLVFNKVTNVDKLEEQFINFFGSEKYGFEARIPQLENDISSLSIVPTSTLFTILKNQQKISLLDFYIRAKELTENVLDYRKQWKAEAKEANDKSLYHKNMELLEFATDITNYVDDIKRGFEI